ncbi:hypothetical protein ACVRXF_01905 [Streptococcus orisasini]
MLTAALVMASSKHPSDSERRAVSAASKLSNVIDSKVKEFIKIFLLFFANYPWLTVLSLTISLSFDNIAQLALIKR